MRSHANRGKNWERMLSLIHARYEAQGLAVVIRTPPPMKILGSIGKGQFRACFESHGPPDYLILTDGLPIMAEAKESAQARWALSNLHLHQADRLSRWQDQRGRSIVLLHHRPSRSHWILPWERLEPTWRSWHETTSQGERAASGSASLSLSDIRGLGLFFELDYLEALRKT